MATLDACSRPARAQRAYLRRWVDGRPQFRRIFPAGLMRPEVASHRGDRMLRLIILVVVLAGPSACAQRPTTVHTLFDGRLDVAIPDSYALYERPDPNRDPESPKNEVGRVEFVRFGGNAALSRKFPDHPFGATFLDRFAGQDVQANMMISLIDLIPTGEPDEWNSREQKLIIPRNADARAIHNRLCQSFASHWGEFGFALFDPETEIGRCVNFAGAFVAVFMRRVGDTLVVVNGLDFVEALIFEKKGPGRAFLEMSPEEKWDAFRAVANATVVEPVLLSAKVR